MTVYISFAHLVPKIRVVVSCTTALTLAVAVTAVKAEPEKTAGKRAVSAQPGQMSPSVQRGQASLWLDSGRTELSLYSGEFVNWVSEMSFYDTPNINMKARWRLVEYVPSSAKWELYKFNKVNNALVRQTITSGVFPSLPDSSMDVTPFSLNLANYLPVHNKTKEAQEYYLTVYSKPVSGTGVIPARRVKIVHLPKAKQKVPAPDNPYACASTANTDRRVRLGIPKVFVEKTTSTPGDGDRDELYILRSRKGPGDFIGATPRLPGNDDYYEAKIGKTLFHGPPGSPANIIPWTNQDGQFENSPVILNMILKHGQTVTVVASLSEQDNEELDDIRTGLITAFTTVAGISSAVGGYGLIVAAAAGGAAAASGAIPQTSFHDQLGTFSTTFTNKCGYVQTTFVAPKTFDFGAAGTATMNFSDINTHVSFNQRLSVLKVADQKFWPNGVDWGAFQPVGDDDAIWMEANGTSQSKYTFQVRADVRLPD
ncbi:hypothetical protein [Sandaracinobacteroides saxicola]|uniref:Uncharacterized protein n=1 Tax=Sandaracinobacteroides saxicola TaxID=2759707 RepID=A0A7G5IHX0_9SPHN|nr:hypothetical protein [Sandaracinobacteroides saxicola]QMW22962.1 hypothetical protein H3309_00140 [Sandaracinobacteroides saxicola]